MTLLNLGIYVECVRMIGADARSKQDLVRSWSNLDFYSAIAVWVNSGLSKVKPRLRTVGSPPRGRHGLTAEQRPRVRPAGLFSNSKQNNTIMKTNIDQLWAAEILDSRGNPTVRAAVTLPTGVVATASVPSGVSTGRREACELRDQDSSRYFGKGVLKAVSNISNVLSPLLTGQDVLDQRGIDSAMCHADGTPNKSNLGANAILAVSLAVARGAAAAEHLPLYAYIGRLAGTRESNSFTLPVPMANVLNGGQHASNELEFQEFMLYPHGAPNFAEALRYAAEIFRRLKILLRARGFSTDVGDEGGFAPDVQSHEEALELIVEAIEDAGYRLNEQVSLALDPAASSFFEKGEYIVSKNRKVSRTSAGMGELYLELVNRYPIVSIEDGAAEDDWEGWNLLTKVLGKKVQLVGDDLFVTNTELLRRGIQEGIANAILIKPNQIGTLSETLDAIAMARTAGYGVIVSHRSGETEDTFIADLAVGTGCGQIKAGSLCRSERVAKYNRLLTIERELGNDAVYYGSKVIDRFKSLRQSIRPTRQRIAPRR
jgi:enolase